LGGFVTSRVVSFYHQYLGAVFAKQGVPFGGEFYMMHHMQPEGFQLLTRAPVLVPLDKKEIEENLLLEDEGEKEVQRPKRQGLRSRGGSGGDGDGERISGYGVADNEVVVLVAHFERLHPAAQFHLARQADVLVGVTGAAMAWSTFMHAGATVPLGGSSGLQPSPQLPTSSPSLEKVPAKYGSWLMLPCDALVHAIWTRNQPSTSHMPVNHETTLSRVARPGTEDIASGVPRPRATDSGAKPRLGDLRSGVALSQCLHVPLTCVGFNVHFVALRRDSDGLFVNREHRTHEWEPVRLVTGHEAALQWSKQRQTVLQRLDLFPPASKFCSEGATKLSAGSDADVVGQSLYPCQGYFPSWEIGAKGQTHPPNKDL
ncbi:unnamed protein product, partial [Symbiodinium microadriaticum]